MFSVSLITPLAIVMVHLDSNRENALNASSTLDTYVLLPRSSRVSVGLIVQVVPENVTCVVSPTAIDT